MGGFSLVHWLLFAVVAVLLLGGGRFSNMMGDVAKGIKNFKKGMAEEDESDRREPSRLESSRNSEPKYDRERDAERPREER
ncbi:twin-arginine translocase TatA/TatE family subunit [Stakelama marina]|uniref:Sec-independent protein translocase protein TatA n=1 Tax=Stakelama marina TaxID=2826939 RepID=A0A8T4I921_9SPHN|nr:twin-arginine translocase TatA/TatE family subunit [Stakelama marina]MBR0551147.1 twin-arginine translocase TatA/TatE family subunit [Stakelama marina]